MSKYLVVCIPGVHINTKTEKMKPEKIRLFYNKTKGGIDTMDQMTRKYSVGARTRRCPLRIFHNIKSNYDQSSFFVHASILLKNFTQTVHSKSIEINVETLCKQYDHDACQRSRSFKCC